MQQTREALADVLRLVELSEDLLAARDQRIGEAREAQAPLGDQLIGGAMTVVDAALRLETGLVEHLVGLALDRVQDRADTAAELGRERGELMVEPRVGTDSTKSGGTGAAPCAVRGVVGHLAPPRNWSKVQETDQELSQIPTHPIG